VRGISSWLTAVVALAVAAGSFDGAATAVDSPLPHDGPVDSPPGTIDAAADARMHLLITEIRTVGAQEFVEIYNPSTTAVALGEYYLSDLNEYWELPGVVAGNTAGPSTANDFLVKFPTGASLRAGGVAVIAIDGPGFAGVYGTPDYTVAIAVSGATPMVISAIGIGASVSLTNAGEMVVLFRWNGVDDLVQDVDLVLAGSQLATDNAPIAKSPIDGPDLDTTATAYAADALTIQDMESDTDDSSGRQSYKRIAAEAGHEVASGGNGIGGHDETSEQARTTWDSHIDPGSYTAATPGVLDF